MLDTGASDALTATTTMSYDDDLNVIAANHYDYATLSQSSAQTAAIGSISAGSLVRTEEATFLVNDTGISSTTRTAYRDRNLLSLPTSARVKNASGTVVAQSQNSYDETSSYPLLTYGSVGGWSDPGTNLRGLPTTTGVWLSATSSYLQTHAQYDQCGNVRSTWDANGHESQVEYSSTYAYAYPTNATTAVPDSSGVHGSSTALTASATYNSNTGLMTSLTDANGQTTSYTYDSINRPSTITRPSGGGSTSYAYGDTPSNLYVRRQTSIDSSRVVEVYQYYDKLGRAGRSFLNEGSTYSTTDTQYDSMGRVWRVSNPYSTTSLSDSVNPSGNWTTTAYDYLGRVTSVTTPDSAVVTSAYSGSTSAPVGTVLTVTDQAGKSRKSVTDGLGRLTTVYEDPATLNYSTSYSYDTLNDLTTVTQGSQTRTFAYDSLKRLTSAANPESGTVSYQYDSNGNLTSKTDARSITSSFTYDALNRVITRSYTNDGGVTPPVNYYYDNAGLPSGTPASFNRGYATGRLVAVTYGSNSSTGDYYSFDALGRQTIKIQQTGGINYKVSAVYDLAGAVTGETYPSGRTLTYDYDNAGRTNNFTGNLGDDTQRTYSTGISYAAGGQMAQEQFGTTTPAYNKLFYNSRGQLAEILVGTAGNDSNRGKIVNDYSNQCSGAPCNGTDNNGNLRKQTVYAPNNEQNSSSTSWYQQYDYDSLNRLQRVHEYTGNTQLDWQQEFVYDRWGNRTIHQANTFGANIPKPNFGVDTSTNRLTAPAGYTMSYDSAGNLTNDTFTGEGIRTYDAENRMKQAWANNQWQTYTYDGDGRRVKRIVNGTETWQVYGLGGELLAEYVANATPATPQKEYGYRNGQLLVTADAPPPAPNGYAYQRSITIDHTKVPNTDQSNFPVLISGTYSYLATTAHGGNVQNTNGYDVIFTSDSSCSTKLNHEVETFNATTGAVNYWVKVPTVSHTSDTNIYMCYGNSNITTDQSTKTGVWDSNYRAVWHLPNGSTLNTNDSTSNANNTTNVGSVGATTGQIDGGGSFNGSSTKLSAGNASSLDGFSSFTLSAWVKANSLPTAARILTKWAPGNDRSWILATDSAGTELIVAVENPATAKMSSWSTTNASLSTGTWYHLVATWSQPSSISIYVNGTAKTLSTTLDQGVTVAGSSSLNALIGGQDAGSGSYWNGIIDEARISNTARSADWIKTEYNNQSSPSTFYTVSSASGGAPAQLHWLVTDQLGTPRMIFDQTGALATVSRHDYLPFGEELGAGTGGRTTTQGYTNSDGARQKFTRKERDTETGLDFFEARYYASTQGRFTSSDPLFVELQRLPYPQAWNLYAYTRNNPLKFVDDDGMEVKVDCGASDGKNFKQCVEQTTTDLNNRKGSQFTTEIKDGKLGVVGNVDVSKLSKSEAELYKAITDTKNISTLTIQMPGIGSENIMFDQYTGRGANTVDRADMNQLNKADKSLSGEAIAHAAIEGYVGVAEGLGTYEAAHKRANEFFGDVRVGSIETLPPGAATATSGRTIYDFQRVGIKATVEKIFITPQPAESVPANWERIRGSLRVIVPGQGEKPSQGKKP
ncbi:MAG TPA: DUF2341 domain-containing protein [Pyrinomonadaceae bacterium]|nr:DUF2341 domain-containing protein [Pyrinomonadaceae bacterium]